MRRRRLRMLDAEELHESAQHFVAKFFSTVGVNLFRNSQFADPVDEDCFGHGDGLFVRDRNGLRVLRRGIRHCEDVLVVFLRCLERAKKIKMNSFVGKFRSRKRVERRPLLWLLSVKLALHARLDVVLDVFSDCWPPIGIGQSKVGLDVSFVTPKKGAVNFADHLCSILLGQVERSAGSVVVVQPDPDDLSFLEQLVGVAPQSVDVGGRRRGVPLSVLEEVHHELKLTVLFLEEAKVGVFVDSVDQMNLLDCFCKSSREKIGRHVDAFLVLD